MRKLVTSDIFVAGRLIKKLDLKDRLKSIYQGSKTVDSENDEAVEAIGIEVMYSIFEECTTKQMESAIYEFLSRPFEKSTKEIEEMELDKFFEMVGLLAKENNLLGFFKQVAKLKL
ncbi:MAG: hypothetical protein RR620_11960 [Clostridium sp.]